jgi:hypothetical protein
MILQSLATALAVMMLSPVTILTVTPAFSTVSTAPGTSSLTMSKIPKMQIRVRPLVSISLMSSVSG